jgi:chromatin modification-related protein VID21
MQARLQQGQAGQQGVPNGNQAQRPQTGGTMPNGTPSGQNLTVPGQNRVRGPMPPQMAGQAQMQNGLRVPQPLMNGVPQAQMQGPQGQLPMPNPALDVGLVTQAHRISEQQRQAIQARQQGQPGLGQIHNSPPRNMNGMSPPNFPQMPNGNMMPFPNTNGVGSPGGASNQSQGQAGSPRLAHPNPMIPHAQRMEEQFRQKYPTASTDQIMRLVTEQLTKTMHQRQGIVQSAMNAAAGGNVGMVNGMAMNGGMNGMNVNNGRMASGVESSPQMYAQMLRQQQENQQKAAQAQAAAAQIAGNVNGNGAQGHQRSGSSNSGK